MVSASSAMEETVANKTPQIGASCSTCPPIPDREAFQRALREYNQKISEITQKDRLQSDIENDLMYRDEERLAMRLNELENAYRQTKFASNRAERVLVKEIDKLKRNQTKLAQNVLKSIREITNQLQETDDELRYQRRNFQQLKERLRDLYQMKKELVESYNEERKEYKDWCTAKRNSGSFSLHPVDYGYPATYPSAHRSQAYGKIFYRFTKKIR
ncbi:unnamed protein product [Gongylonema pulchrum]|uniref:Uncharacterized protein n=1 Tax=Gongylonema pulchrum TaxID=637853 RepID=A0A3P7RCE7_9BILA|nr:unnamed protein product [Gongylonema pulchrum]